MSNDDTAVRKRRDPKAGRANGIDAAVQAMLHVSMRTPKSLPPIGEIRTALERLDSRLAEAVQAFEVMQGGPVTDRFRGLVISPEQCSTALSPRDWSAAMRDCALWPLASSPCAQRLAARHGLTQFDLDILLLALASEFDLRYERLFAYLQDDVTRKRPTVDLVLRLLCPDDAARFVVRGRFSADAPLLRHGLVQLVNDPGVMHPPLLARAIGPDEQTVRWLLGTGGLHAELAAVCTRSLEIRQPHDALSGLAVPPAVQQELRHFAEVIASDSVPTPTWLQSAGGNGSGEVGRAVATTAGVSLLQLDATRVPANDAERMLVLVLREAWLGGDLLYIDRVDAWLVESGFATRLAALLREPHVPVLLGAACHIPTDLLGAAVPLVLPMPEASERHACWQGQLAQHRVSLPVAEVRTLSARFRLAPSQIAAAVADACLRTRGAPSRSALEAAAREQSGDALTLVTDKVDARATWDDIVLPADVLAQLRELCDRVEQRERVFNDWGFGRKLSRGRGTAALFSGGSGTGKTMAAEVVANALGLDLYRIDLARVVDKYIGETEKKLDKVFRAAESANAILFFDEADALFGKRGETKDANDHYANLQVAYLLQKMEAYDGVAILATNLAGHFDEAFSRRLSQQIDFPFPDEATRARLWQRAWPPLTPLAPEIDATSLARELRVSGGSIRNIALAAAFYAAERSGPVTLQHLAQAIRRELKKMGRSGEMPESIVRTLGATPLKRA